MYAGICIYIKFIHNRLLAERLNNIKRYPFIMATSVAKGASAQGMLERCVRCGEIMIETHCKVMCTNCGYSRDCNDQWD